VKSHVNSQDLQGFFSVGRNGLVTFGVMSQVTYQ